MKEIVNALYVDCSIKDKINATYQATESLLTLGLENSNPIFKVLEDMRQHYINIREQYRKIQDEIRETYND